MPYTNPKTINLIKKRLLCLSDIIVIIDNNSQPRKIAVSEAAAANLKVEQRYRLCPLK
jgi:hypothetical protein